MSSNLLSRLRSPSRDTRSFYEQLRPQDDHEYDPGLDEENLGQRFDDFHAEELGVSDSRMTVESAVLGAKSHKGASDADTHTQNPGGPSSRWQDDEADNDVPESLLVEPREVERPSPKSPRRSAQSHPSRASQGAGLSSARTRAQWEVATTQQRLHGDGTLGGVTDAPQPRPFMKGVSSSPRERALWRWVNTTNLDSFMRDAYDYYEGGGLLCILCANALWLL